MGSSVGSKIFPWVVMTLFLVIGAGIVLFMFGQVQGLRNLTETRLEYNGESFMSVVLAGTVAQDDFQDAWDSNTIYTLKSSVDGKANVVAVTKGTGTTDFDATLAASTKYYTPQGKTLTTGTTGTEADDPGYFTVTVPVKEPLYIMESNATIYNLAVVIIPILIALVALGWVINWGTGGRGLKGVGKMSRMGG